MITIEKIMLKTLNKLKGESCGFLLAKNTFYNKYFEIKNVSRKKNEYRMSFIDKVYFNIYFTLSNYNYFMIYHKHQYVKRLSEKDVKNMVEDIIYVIIYKGKVYGYIKIGNIISQIGIDVK